MEEKQRKTEGTQGRGRGGFSLLLHGLKAWLCQAFKPKSSRQKVGFYFLTHTLGREAMSDTVRRFLFDGLDFAGSVSKKGQAKPALFWRKSNAKPRARKAEAGVVFRCFYTV